MQEILEIFREQNYISLPFLTDSLEIFFQKKKNSFCHTLKSIEFDVIDEEYFTELKNISSAVTVCFGSTLKDLKCVISDDERLREHEIFIKYKSPRKYVVHSVNLPFSPCQDKEYSSLNELITTFRNFINDLSNYFRELERIDQMCPVIEPTHPKYKDDYRKILLDSRTWLHIEVTLDGTATNIHLIGNSEVWSDKLHSGLLSWDHDKDIVENIMIIFDISRSPSDLHLLNLTKPESDVIAETRSCGICLCNELPGNAGIPQPLCQNSVCGVFFHRSCLFEWLLACTGGRPPAFQVATGSCPTCLHPIACSQTDERISK